jgi:beta-lactam-binding protein with PASTA domain
MKKLAIAAITAALLAAVMSGAALWRTRHLSSSEPSGSVQVDVPDGTNKSVYAAGQALNGVKLKFKVVRAPSATVAKQVVISQTPAAGTKVMEGSEVELTVSNGPP